MIEPGIASDVNAAVSAMVDWEGQGKCGVCLACRGEPCVALNGRVAGARPDGVRTALPRPHAARRALRRRPAR